MSPKRKKLGIYLFYKDIYSYLYAILKTEIMNVFEKLTKENQEKIKSFDIGFKEKHPEMRSHEERLREIDYYDLKVDDLMLTSSICGYATMDDCWFNGFNR